MQLTLLLVTFVVASDAIQFSNEVRPADIVVYNLYVFEFGYQMPFTQFELLFRRSDPAKICKFSLKNDDYAKEIVHKENQRTLGDWVNNLGARRQQLNTHFSCKRSFCGLNFQIQASSTQCKAKFKAIHHTKYLISHAIIRWQLVCETMNSFKFSCFLVNMLITSCLHVLVLLSVVTEFAKARKELNQIEKRSDNSNLRYFDAGRATPSVCSDQSAHHLRSIWRKPLQRRLRCPNVNVNRILSSASSDSSEYLNNVCR